ncbi:phosphoenolpyruvate synthase [Rubritalea profundi]|uniref:Phosphoenolpyruvate synthase n=1 Tax=Rubritalea profundi TaxID=1658618 RepID=A0A2S7U2M5_9BACT|nr:phosphoenolpyruvate synthase [Rubritalea profundi]PQJ28654.1 phosphoenolpyruvate synthase [Rubritalea profundi]
MKKNVIWLKDVTIKDIALVGGKSASLGEMISQMSKQGIVVPSGFAVTANAYREFTESNGITDDVSRFMEQFHGGFLSLEEVGANIRKLILEGEFPAEMREQIVDAYRGMSRDYDCEQVDVAVRSSATAEDLPNASFAGQQDSYLNIKGEEAMLDACRKCFASLYTNRAISYREQKGFADVAVYLSVAVQKMMRADSGAAGVMFTLDVDTGFRDVVVIEASFGLGENIVKGTVTPDEYRVYKPLLGKKGVVPIISKKLGSKELTMIYSEAGDSVENVPTPMEMRWKYALSDKQIMQLSEWAVLIESHYGKPMDIEWALDGLTGELAIVQARPETVRSMELDSTMVVSRLKNNKSEPLIEGLGIGSGIAAGNVMVLNSLNDAGSFEKGMILVTSATDPDWVPLMKIAAGLITDHGGRTSHAAIVSRELGVPAIIGTENATRLLHEGQAVTINCASTGKGEVYEGILDYETEEIDLSSIPETRTKVMLNIANPDTANRSWRLPCDGIGLARMEFIISNQIGVHPMALINFDRLTNENAFEEIEVLTHHYKDKKQFFVDRLAYGIAQIAASQYPEPVIVRTSDFKTNEYRDLLGGDDFEPVEENPMLGFRGASRYYSEEYREGFALECRALKWVRERMGLKNLIVMIPFCRTLEEADKVLNEMALNGLVRGDEGLQVYMMAEIPSNIILAKDFAERFDGFSIGSNDLTQLVLGVDRDSEKLANLFDENNEAVREMIRVLIKSAHEQGCKVGICGQAPSDKPEFAQFLVAQGIDSISLTPDSFVLTKRAIAARESEITEG